MNKTVEVSMDFIDVSNYSNTALPYLHTLKQLCKVLRMQTVEQVVATFSLLVTANNEM